MKKTLITLIALLVVTAFVLYRYLLTFSSHTDLSTLPQERSETLELSFAHHMPVTSVTHRAALRFAELVEQKSGGEVRVRVYPGQELGNSFEMIERARAGDIDITLTPTAKMGVLVPSVQYADLPFLFPSEEDAHALLDGKVGAILLKDLESIGLYGAAFWEGGFKQFISDKPLMTPEDFKDEKIRVMKSRIVIEQIEALGAKPVPIDFYSVRDALHDGVVTALENPLVSIVSMNFHQDLGEVTLSAHGYLAHILSFSIKSFEKLPLKIQKILVASAKEVTPWQREQIARDEVECLKTLKKAGVRVHTPAPEVRARLKEMTSHILKQNEALIGAHIISETECYFDAKRPHDDVVVIGVDADLSMGAKGGGLAIKRGVELAVDAINRQGGLLGKKVVVLARDHRGVSTQALENIHAFLDDDRTIAVIGGKHSAIISAYTPEIQSGRLLFFSPWAAAPSVTENGYKENYIFRVSLNDRYASGFLASEALKRGSNPAIVVENSVWGKEGLANIQAYLSAHGVSEREGIIVNRGETNFAPLFDQLRLHGYDTMILVLNSQEAARLVTELGQKHMSLPLISHWGIVGDAFFESTKRYLSQIDLRFIQTFTLVNNHRKQARALQAVYADAYAKKEDEPINAVTGVAQAYDAVVLLAAAVRKAGSFESEKIKAALEDLGRVEGVIKSYAHPFDAANHDALNVHDFFMARYNETGEIVPLAR